MRADHAIASEARALRQPRRRKQAFAIELCEPRRLLASFYVSPTGSDAADGLSPATALQTIGKVNQLDLEPGDQVLFEGGQTFAGNILPDGGFESGTFDAWIESFDETPGNTSLSIAPGDPHDGQYGVVIDGLDAGGRGQLVTSLVSPGVTYDLTFWARKSAGLGDAFGGITFFDGIAEVARFSVPLVGDTWTQYFIHFTAPANWTYADVWAKATAGDSVVRVDDFALTPVNTLFFDAADSGTPAQPVTIGSYGAGRATIHAGDYHALFATNVSGFVLRDLVFTGNWDGLAAAGTSETDGIEFLNNLPGNAKLDYLRIDNVEVSNFKFSGLAVRGGNAKAGYNDVRITNVNSHDNGDVGIDVEGVTDLASTLYAHSNIYVGWSRAYNNGGLPDKDSHTGSGIVLSDVDGGVIERSLAWNNGQNCNFPGGGPIGIWSWDSNNITIQYNESFSNKTGSSSRDGGGFDFDGGVTNSVIQYNYSHDNDGAGYLLYQFNGARPFGNNIVRYNISQNDARQGRYAAIYLGGGNDIQHNHIYGNTIFVSPSGYSGLSALLIDGVGDNNVFRNNIIYVTNGVQLLDTDVQYSASDLLFQGNNWYVASGAFDIDWGGDNVTSLSSFRNKGQEKIGSTNTGTTINPQLINPGGGGTIADPARLQTLLAYQRLATSPVTDGGVDLTSFGVDPGPRDYYGFTSRHGAGFDIGAFEHAPVITGSAGDEDYVLRAGPGGSTHLFINTPVSEAPTLAWAAGVFSSIEIRAEAGDDALALDDDIGIPVPFDGGAGSNSLTVNAGSYAFNGASAAANLSVSVAAGASVHFASPQTLASLFVAGSATVAPGGATTLLVKSLTVTGLLDLRDNDLVVDYDAASPIGNWTGSSYDGISGLIRAGRIASSTAGATQGLGVAEATEALSIAGTETASWSGRAVDASSVLIKFTYRGDANIDGKINVDDYGLIDGHVSQSGSTFGWYRGDFNLDGSINIDDYGIIDATINAQGAPL